MLLFKTLTFDEAENDYDFILERDTGIPCSRTEIGCECCQPSQIVSSSNPKDVRCLMTANIDGTDVSSEQNHPGSNSLAVLDALKSLVLIVDRLRGKHGLGRCVSVPNYEDPNRGCFGSETGLRILQNRVGLQDNQCQDVEDSEESTRAGCEVTDCSSQMFLRQTDDGSVTEGRQVKGLGRRDVTCMDQLSLAIVDSIGFYPEELDNAGQANDDFEG